MNRKTIGQSKRLPYCSNINNHAKEIGGFNERDASDYAYFFAEAVVYDTFTRLMKLTGNDENMDEYIKGISVAVSVDDTTKITIK